MLPRNNNSLMERIETTILRNLVFNEDYSRKVIPFIQPDYFEQKTEKVIFEEIVQFIVKYGSAITVEALNIEIENRTDLTEEQIKEIREINGSLNDSPVDKQWLLDITVMGHLGLTPQSIYKFGTYTVRAKEEAEAEKLLEDAKMLEKLGCFALVLEKIPAALAEKVAKSISIPVIGIGAAVS